MSIQLYVHIGHENLSLTDSRPSEAFLFKQLFQNRFKLSAGFRLPFGVHLEHLDLCVIDHVVCKSLI